MTPVKFNTLGVCQEDSQELEESSTSALHEEPKQNQKQLSTDVPDSAKALAKDQAPAAPELSCSPERRSLATPAGAGGNGGPNDVLVPPAPEGGAATATATNANDRSAQAGAEDLMPLMCVLGAAYSSLAQYKCRDAIELLHRLPACQFRTGWVQQQLGKAYYELSDYRMARSALEQMALWQPDRLEGLELLSTCLWQLKQEVELCYLAQKVKEFDQSSPYTWSVIGNCFSLLMEHETALKFFQRSVQLDPNFTYGHTLCGHEYVANEDFDKAIACYREAIRTDSRHYNAWYGLGNIYHRQEKYDLAEYHYRRALGINPESVVLRVYLGLVLRAKRKYPEAMEMLELATQADPTNPQARFERANTLQALERYEEALDELKSVRDAVPKESNVYFEMGKVFASICFLIWMGETGLVQSELHCFTMRLEGFWFCFGFILAIAVSLSLRLPSSIPFMQQSIKVSLRARCRAKESCISNSNSRLLLCCFVDLLLAVADMQEAWTQAGCNAALCGGTGLAT
ncbi:unnamed protein product [Chrysoparadoxa australica]